MGAGLETGWAESIPTDSEEPENLPNAQTRADSLANTGVAVDFGPFRSLNVAEREYPERGDELPADNGPLE